MKSSIKKGIDVLKSNPHALLSSAKDVAMPTEEQVRAAATPEECHAHLETIGALKKMHTDDYDLYYQLDDLEIAALERAFELSENEQSGQELAS